jgi:hypothetical protein
MLMASVGWEIMFPITHAELALFNIEWHIAENVFVASWVFEWHVSGQKKMQFRIKALVAKADESPKLNRNTQVEFLLVFGKRRGAVSDDIWDRVRLVKLADTCEVFGKWTWLFEQSEQGLRKFARCLGD